MISVAPSWQCLDSSSRSRSIKKDMGGSYLDVFMKLVNG